MYYYLPSLELEAAKRSSVYAKCVVVDGETTFLSSANFTEEAQNRNVEVGQLLRARLHAGRITHHFDALIEDGKMESLALPDM